MWDNSVLPKISNEDSIMLCQQFNVVEVLRAVKEMEGDKTPGPDGFPILFFQTFWDLVKEDVMLMMDTFWEKGYVEGKLIIHPIYFSFLR